MAIIVSKNNKNAKKLEESGFNLENHLQEYIYDNPDVVPIYEIEEDARLFIAAREFATNSGPIDALGFDQQGNIYVIETKLYKNPDKRTVVAQALDYGASLWRHSTNFEEFITQLDAHTQKQFQKSFDDAFKDFFGVSDTGEAVENMKTNINTGVIKFVILMDTLHDRLKDLIIYVNQNSKFDLYAVELEYYKHDEFEIIIPKLYGAEVKKDISTPKSASGRRKWDEASFWQAVENNLDPDTAQAMRKLYNWSKNNADKIAFGTGTSRGSFSPKIESISPRSIFTMSTNGKLTINYGWQSEEVSRHLFDVLKNHISVEGVTDLPPDRTSLHEYYPIILEDYLTEHMDDIIAALSEFIQ